MSGWPFTPNPKETPMPLKLEPKTEEKELPGDVDADATDTDDDDDTGETGDPVEDDKPKHKDHPNLPIRPDTSRDLPGKV